MRVELAVLQSIKRHRQQLLKELTKNNTWKLKQCLDALEQHQTRYLRLGTSQPLSKRKRRNRRKFNSKGVNSLHKVNNTNQVFSVEKSVQVLARLTPKREIKSESSSDTESCESTSTVAWSDYIVPTGTRKYAKTRNHQYYLKI